MLGITVGSSGIVQLAAVVGYRDAASPERAGVPPVLHKPGGSSSPVPAIVAREYVEGCSMNDTLRLVFDRFGSPSSSGCGAEPEQTIDKSVNGVRLRRELNVRESDVRGCDESSCKYGGVCKEEGDGLKCACQFQIMALGQEKENNLIDDSELDFMHILPPTLKRSHLHYSSWKYSPTEYEGSGTEVQRKHSKCGVCKYRAECDEDAENVGCVCNIDCSGYSFNPVCASDGSSYNNPCFVREASCLRQEQIDIRHLGHCSETDDTNAVGKKDDGMQYRPEVKDASDQREDIYIGNHIPCSESFNGYCIHGKCEFIYSTQKASCRCESGYTGQHCEKTDFSILYVVPSRQKLTHVLIAAIIGAVQIAIIVAIVMCITRKCPKNNRGRRQKQNLGHFTSDTSSRMGFHVAESI
ncbi:hypothetical protein DV515_00000064 [Chloebia gouldiae]|uniref:Tomoregulin-1 n=1 Tax=Chloebia gouldiae TaxID=44316 RepID=A0A3L8T133_CHLGU|nr:hypothetical protein DV515_00000064 [Chloebia gouldiae]